jgi:hypothetical protein
VADEELRASNELNRRPDVHFSGEDGGGCCEAYTTDRDLAGANVRRVYRQFRNVLEQRPLIRYPNSETGIESTKALGVQRGKPEEDIVQMLRAFNPNQGLDFQPAVFIS